MWRDLCTSVLNYDDETSLLVQSFKYTCTYSFQLLLFLMFLDNL